MIDWIVLRRKDSAMKVRVTGLSKGAKDSAADYNRPLRKLGTLALHVHFIMHLCYLTAPCFNHCY